MIMRWINDWAGSIILLYDYILWRRRESNFPILLWAKVGVCEREIREEVNFPQETSCSAFVCYSAFSTSCARDEEAEEIY